MVRIHLPTELLDSPGHFRQENVPSNKIDRSSATLSSLLKQEDIVRSNPSILHSEKMSTRAETFFHQNIIEVVATDVDCSV